VLGSPPDPSSSSFFEVELTAVFGVGASGLAGSASPANSEGGVVFTVTAAGVVGVRRASPENVEQHISTSAVKINDHLSHCRPGEGAGVTATHLTLLYHRTGVTGPSVMVPMVLLCTSPVTLRSGPFVPVPSFHRPRFAEELRYNPAR